MGFCLRYKAYQRREDTENTEYPQSRDHAFRSTQ